MKYKVGDKVRIIDKRNSLMSCLGLMDCWLGKVMTIEKVCDEYCSYRMKEDGQLWFWHEEMIAEKVEEEQSSKTVKTVKDVFEEFEAGKNAGFEVKFGCGQVVLVLHYAGEKRVLIECDPANAFYSANYEKDKAFLVRLSEVSKVKVGRVWMDTTKTKAEEDPEFANVPANWAENLPQMA